MLDAHDRDEQTNQKEKQSQKKNVENDFLLLKKMHKVARNQDSFNRRNDHC